MARRFSVLKNILLLVMILGESVFAAKVCRGVYGCFDTLPPWDNPLAFYKLPQTISQISTTFKLYNEAKPNGDLLDNTNPVTSDIKEGDKIVVLIHGLTTAGGHDESMYTAMRPDLLAKRNSTNQKYLNVITVDWTGGVKLSDLPQTFGNVRLVAKQTAYLIKKLESRDKLFCSDVHIIGFSLGASLAGLVGKSLKAQNCAVPRITGLDPVLNNYERLFKTLPNKTKLHRSDATYVDVIHTHTRNTDRIGEADFFANGGYTQPGCSGPNAAHCHHFRAVKLFTSTILAAGDCCQGTKCRDYATFTAGGCSSNPTRKMGFGSQKSDASNGKYYLTTGATDPYCGPCSGGTSTKHA